MKPLAVIEIVAEDYGLEAGDLIAQDRHKTTAEARAVAYWLLRQRGLSYPEIGRAVGKRDHTTAISGVRKAESLRVGRPGFAARLAGLQERCEAFHSEVVRVPGEGVVLG